jgi:hypothetical protein
VIVNSGVTSANHIGNWHPASSESANTRTEGLSQMASWRIRINLSDDARTRARFAEVLASQQVTAVQLTPRADADSVLAGDVLLELPRDDELGDMLTALHMISPQVFVSRALSEHGGALDNALAALPQADLVPCAD